MTYVLALLFYAFALGAKEVALLTLPIYFLIYIYSVERKELGGEQTSDLMIGPNYGTRAIESFSVFGFLVPCIVSALLVRVSIFIAKGSNIQKIGLAIFILPLLPAFNVTAFIPEQIAYD